MSINYFYTRNNFQFLIIRCIVSVAVPEGSGPLKLCLSCLFVIFRKRFAVKLIKERYFDNLIRLFLLFSSWDLFASLDEIKARSTFNFGIIFCSSDVTKQWICILVAKDFFLLARYLISFPGFYCPLP